MRPPGRAFFIYYLFILSIGKKNDHISILIVINIAHLMFLINFKLKKLQLL